MIYKKKPVLIEAHRFDGSSTGCSELRAWIENGKFLKCQVRTRDIGPFQIETLEGIMTASPGDYIIKGIEGEFYPCKPDIFDKTYERVEEK